jgi:hypothetical protein
METVKDLKLKEIERCKQAKDLENIERETPLVPYLIAHDVSYDLIVGKKYSEEVKRYNALSETEKVEFDKKVDSEIDELLFYLKGRAELLYINNKKFKKDLNKENTCRESLKMFMAHWGQSYMKYVK